MDRTIIHLNIAHFSVAVERCHDRHLRGRTLIIAPKIPRALVYDMSEEAYRDGVRKNMALSQARRRCPHAVILAPAFERYTKAMGECMQQTLPFTPLVEQAPGNGHLYLDISGTRRLLGSPADIGQNIRNIFRRELGLYPVWTVAANKLVAKVASRTVKPAGERVVTAGTEREFLAPLPLTLLPTIHKKACFRLHELGIHSIAQAAALSLQDLHLLCGGQTETLYNSLRGIDHTLVRSYATREKGRAFVFQHHCAPCTNREDVIRRVVCNLAAQAGYKLRKQQLGCRRIRIRLRYSDGVCAQRRITCKTLLVQDQELQQQAESILYRCWRRRVLIRTIELDCSLVAYPARQLSLLDHINKKQQKDIALERAVDLLHERFGRSILTHGDICDQ